jgi:hypothetical protein
MEQTSNMDLLISTNMVCDKSLKLVDDYSFVRHPPGHRLSESACERAHELGVPVRWVCRSSLD